MRNFNKENVVYFIKDQFSNDVGIFLRAVFNENTISYYEGQIDLATQCGFEAFNLAIENIAECVIDNYVSWKDMFKVLNQSIEISKTYDFNFIKYY